jgi:hypothetical protein
VVGVAHSAELRDAHAGDVLEERVGWAGAEDDVDEDLGRRRAAASLQVAELVDELADALVARTS